MRYSWEQCFTLPDLKLTHKQAQHIVDSWMAVTPSIPEPLPVAAVDTEFLTYRKLPWTLTKKEKETPVFDEMFKRMTNAEAVKAWIGSLFFLDSPRHQYVWIYGDGDDGKGRLASFLHAVFGGAYRAEHAPKNGDRRFWTAGLIGSRLVVFPDCNDFDFPQTGLFKASTGDDPVRIEVKNKMPYTAELHSKFLFLSNERPGVIGNRANLRRAIFCEMTKFEGAKLSPKEVQRRLWLEGEAFLSKCIDLYKNLCPNDEDIPVDMKDLTDLTDDNEAEFEDMFHKNFIIEEGAFCMAGLFLDVCRHWHLSNMQIRNFKAFLERRFKIKRVRESEPFSEVKNVTIKVTKYPGMRLRRVDESGYFARKFDCYSEKRTIGLVSSFHEASTTKTDS